MSQPELSILIPGLPERIITTDHDQRMDADALLYELMEQIGEEPVELLYLLDNRKMSVGRKRSILLSIAQGRYFTFIDDDDSVAGDYVDTLLEAVGKANGADVICFLQECRHVQTGVIEHCRYGLGLKYDRTEVGPKEYDWTGLPAHTMLWRTDLVQDLDFPEGNFGEDVQWVARACKRAVTEYQIERVLYYYNFDEKKSATRR